jgi:hypothetical protein
MQKFYLATAWPRWLSPPDDAAFICAGLSQVVCCQVNSFHVERYMIRWSEFRLQDSKDFDALKIFRCRCSKVQGHVDQAVMKPSEDENQNGFLDWTCGVLEDMKIILTSLSGST